MMFRIVFLLLSVLIVAIAAGCEKDNPHINAHIPTSTWISNDLACSLSYRQHPDALDITQFQLIVNDNHSKRIKGLKASIDLSMPSMSMPKNIIVCKETQTGVYSGSGRYTMTGDWRITVIIKKNGSIINTHVVDVVVR